MATYYWVGGTGTWNSTSTTNWASGSGGTGGAGYPTILDDVVFDTSSGTGTVTITSGVAFCRDFTVTATQALTFTGSSPQIAGNFFLPAGGSIVTSTFTVTFIAGSAKSITTNGKTVSAMLFTNPSGTWTLQDSLTLSGALTLTAGTLNTNNKTVTAINFTSTGTIPRSLILGSSLVNLSTSGGVWTTTSTGFTFVPGTSTITFSSGSIVLSTGGLTFNNVTFGSASSIQILDANTFNNVTVTSPATSVGSVLLSANQTITGTLTASGSSNIVRIFFKSDTVGTRRTLTVAAWPTPAYLDFRDISIAGAVGTLTGTSMGDCGNNSGITFTAAKTVYWNLTGTQFWDSTGWATSSGGTPAAANFPLAQDTCIFNNTGAMTSVSIAGSFNIGTLDASARTTAGTLTGTSQFPTFYGNVILGTGITTGSPATWVFSKQGTQTVNTNGVVLAMPLIVNGGTGIVRFLGNVTCSVAITSVTLTSGTLDLNGFALTLSSNNSGFAITANTLARSIAFGTTGSISIASISSNVIWSAATLTGFTLTGTPTVNITNDTSNSRTISHGSTSGGTEANAISINLQAANGIGGQILAGVFRNIDLTGSAGGLTNSARTVYGNFVISTGTTVLAGTAVTTFAGTNATQDLTTNGKTLDFPISISGTNTVLRMQDALTQGTSRSFTIGTGCTFNANTFSASVGTLTFSATPTITNLASNTLTCAAVAQSGGTLTMSASLRLTVTGTYTMSGGTLDFGNQSVSFGTFFTSGSSTKIVNLGSGTITITGSGAGAWTANTTGTTINSGTSTISMTSVSAKSFVPGSGQVYYNLVQAGTGTLTIGGNPATYNTISNTVQPTTILFVINNTHTVNSLNLNGTAGNLVTIGPSVALGTYAITYTGSTVNTMNFVSVSGFTGITTGIFFATNSVNDGNNGNLIFGAADTTPRYWVGGTASWTYTATANWATSSGGTGGASAPTIETDVYFDANSNVGTGAFTVSLSGTSTSGLVCRNLTISGLDGALSWTGSGTVNVYGSWAYPATNFSRTYTGPISFKSTATGRTITSNGQTLTTGNVTFDGVGGGWTLADALSGINFLTVTNGSFSTGGFAVSGGFFSSGNSNVRSINLGASTLTFVGSSAWTTTITNLTFTAGTSQIILSAQNAILDSGGLTFNNVSLTNTASGTSSIPSAATFNNLTLTPPTGGLTSFSIGANLVITGTLSCSGASAVQRIMLRSDTLGTQRTLTVGAFATATDIDFRDIQIAGTAAPVSGTRLGDCGGNGTSLVTSTPKTVYWNSSAGTSFQSASWAATDGGAVNINNYPLPQDTAVFTNTAPTTGQTVTWGTAPTMNYPAINASGRTTAMTLDSLTNTPSIYGSFLLGAGVTIAGSGGHLFSGRGSHVITSAGKTFSANVVFNTVTGTYTLTDAFSLSTAYGITVTSGNFNSASQIITAGTFATSTTTTPKSINFGTSTVNLLSASTVLLLATTAQGLTVSGANCIINLTSTNTTGRTVNGGGQTLGTLNIGGITGTSTTSLEGTGTTWNNITSTKTVAHTILISASTVINFNNFNVSGTAGNLVTLIGVNSSSIYNYTGSDVVSTDYVSAGTTSAFTPAPSTTGLTPYRWYLGANSVNTSSSPGTLGAAFIAGTQRAYLITSTSVATWTVPSNWDSNNNNIYLIGAGGGGGTSSSSGNNRAASGGGGGGGYTAATNAVLTPNSSIGIVVGSSSIGSKGGDTYFNAAYLAGGGQAGSSTTAPSSEGGAGGTGTFAGGTGGAGAFGTTIAAGYGSGGGGGAGGPNGVGGAGGNGFGSTTTADMSGGGGGGNGGGGAGGNATAGLGGTGGNNFAGTGGGAGGVSGAGGTGTFGGGGGGSSNVGRNGAGGAGRDILNTIGGSGGNGGKAADVGVSSPGLYGSGGCGATVNVAGTVIGGSAGGQGVAFIVYTPVPPITITGVTILGGVIIG